jgi:hypothetical protein
MNYSQILNYITVGVTAAVAFLAVVAPITRTDLDNKLLEALRWLETVALKTLLPGRNM